MQAGQFVVVRTYSAGVHAGELVSQNGKEVTLKNARRIWYWRGANTLHEVATKGVGPGSKVSVAVESIDLTEAIEVLQATDEGATNLRGAAWTE